MIAVKTIDFKGYPRKDSIEYVKKGMVEMANYLEDETLYDRILETKMTEFRKRFGKNFSFEHIIAIQKT